MFTAESASGSGWNVQYGGQNQQRRSQVGTAATGNPFLHDMSGRDLDKSSLLRFDSRLLLLLQLIQKYWLIWVIFDLILYNLHM